MPGASFGFFASNAGSKAFPPSGQGYIAGESPGLVTVAGSPASRKVQCFERASGTLVAETVSAADGTYRFDYLNPGLRYYVVAFDHTLQFNSVIRDNITPAVDP